MQTNTISLSKKSKTAMIITLNVLSFSPNDCIKSQFVFVLYLFLVQVAKIYFQNAFKSFRDSDLNIGKYRFATMLSLKVAMITKLNCSCIGECQSKFSFNDIS